MKTYTEEELANILNLHKEWLSGKESGVMADLRYSDLSYSNLRGSDLCYSDLRNSDLSNANLSGSDLRSSDLRGSDLRGSDLRNANLSNANIEGTKFYFPVTLPEGQFVAWKKVKDKNYNSIILKLIIPADAKRVSTPFGRKCRASKAFVDSAWDLEGN